ncbi:MAG: sugar transferase [Actinobacteria bacterium]|nr:sugar transferase [Actinomycetota bacterium]
MESSTAASAGAKARELRVPASASKARRRGVVLSHRLWVSDLISSLLAAVIAAVIFEPGASILAIIGFALMTALLWSFFSFALGLHSGDRLGSWASSLNEVAPFCVGLLLLSWPVFVAAAALDLGSPAITAVCCVALLGIFDSIGRTIVRTRIHRVTDLRQRTLILGSGVVAGQLVGKLRNNDQYGLVPIGMVDDEFHPVGEVDLPLLGGFSELSRLLSSRQIARVIIAFSRASHVELLDAIRTCRDAGVAIDVVPRLFEFLDGARALDQVGGLPLISLGPARLTRSARIAKRIVDVAGSAVALVVLSPVLLGIAAAIRIESRGPVFFRQRRAGRHNEPFEVLKFRSMYADAEERKAALEKENESTDGVMFKIRDDPRITRVGRLIRRTSIDELPQLFNVLRGDMSLVGPRPIIFREAEALEDWHLRRAELRPGLTGPWQIYGRSQSPFQEMVRFDYQYVAGWSLARDIEILLATLPAVLSGRGAY